MQRVFASIAPIASGAVLVVVLTLALMANLMFFTRNFQPLYQHAKVEKDIAEFLLQTPDNERVYAFALKPMFWSYLPDLEYVSIWERDLDAFTPGSLVAFNPPRANSTLFLSMIVRSATFYVRCTTSRILNHLLRTSSRIGQTIGLLGLRTMWLL